MSNQHDQSYYEIALTNRQVMSIFVVLLISILAAFLGGVWLGRGAAESAEMTPVRSMEAVRDSAEAPLEQLDFFTRREGSSAASQDGSPGKPGEQPTAAGTAAGREPSARVPDAAGAGNRPRAPIAVADRTEPVDNEATNPPESGVSEVVPPAPQPEAQSAQAESGAPPAGVPDFLVIQVFSSNEEAQARRVMNQLRKGGYPAILSPVEVDGQILHRVRIGPYTDEAEAQVVAASVRRAYKLDTWITR